MVPPFDSPEKDLNELMVEMPDPYGFRDGVYKPSSCICKTCGVDFGDMDRFAIHKMNQQCKPKKN